MEIKTEELLKFARLHFGDKIEFNGSTGVIVNDKLFGISIYHNNQILRLESLIGIDYKVVNEDVEKVNTFMGYNINQLGIYGQILVTNGITPEQLKDANENIKYGFKLAMQQYERAFEQTFSTFKGETKWKS